MVDLYNKLSVRDLILIVAAVGLLARILVGMFYTYPIEDNYWILASSNFTAGEGLYDLPGYYYLPLWGYILVIITAVANFFGIPYGHYISDIGTSIKDCDVVLPTMEYSLMVLAVLIVFDVLVAYLIYKLGVKVTGDEKKSVLMAAVWFLCPLTIAMSSVRLMFENVEIFLLLASFLLMMYRRPMEAGLLMGACLLSKQFGIFAAVILIGYAYAQTRDLRYVAKYVLGTVVMVLVLMAPVILGGDFATSMHWLTSRADAGTSSSMFNLTLYLMPIIILFTLAATYLIAKKGITDFGQVSLIMVLPVAAMLMIAGNVQYYLFLLPFLLFVIDKYAVVPFVIMGVLGCLSLTSFITMCSEIFVESGWPLSGAVESITAFLSPLEGYTWFYEIWKSITGISVVAFILFLLLRWRCSNETAS